ncbi:carotenoid ester lipase precursor [Pluteus cervinus]|uniref:Carotenoid ester lipase n=1 Tax=Pluteus cervinus TaxID=181527 RepID=A0ACD3AYX9_9AGAR|nr:carotenoid ester lipase precursor [Pluteus cervinus]
MPRILPNLLLVIAAHLQLSQALPAGTPPAAASSTVDLPTVRLDNATVYGWNAVTVNEFLGIPYALPPSGDRRLRLPQPNDPYTTDFAAWYFGASCPQQDSTAPSAPAAAVPGLPSSNATGQAAADDEDCLNLNIVVPADAKPGSNLPVVIWIYGGSFQSGSASFYDGKLIVDRSIQMGEPVIYVGINYRLSALGFLASKEVKAAGVGNLGLQDQRQAFRWVQKYIGAFGGDPKKVTIWGESAGAVSVGFHLVANNGNNEGLFRAGFMQSGSPVPVGDITNGQQYYDFMVAQTGCSSASDTLECLRGVPYAAFKAALDQSPGIYAYQSLSLAWRPRVDGIFITDVPQKLVQAGKVANVPIITGDCDDEGTVFALSTFNITTDAQFKAYVKQYFFPTASSSDLDRLLWYYPNDLRAGSPYDTGFLGGLTQQYKRIASFMGDVAFQAPRRFLLQQRSQKQNSWSYLSKRFKSTPAYGSWHGSDLVNSWAGELLDYLVNFANNLDPNGKTQVPWPKYNNWSPLLLTFLDGPLPVTVTRDDYRDDAMDYLTDVSLRNPW